MALTSEQINDLASDAVVLERAKALTRRRQWAHLFNNDTLIWGVCKGSGEAIYDVGFHPTQKGFYCSCPSTLRPCKHLLALLFLFAEQPRWFKHSVESPIWQKELKPLNPQSRQKPAEGFSQFLPDEKRLELMGKGMKVLESWLLDLLRQGLAYAEAQPVSFWENIAAAMVDAKLGSIGRRIRRWPLIFQQPDWPGLLLGEIAYLQLLAQGYRRLSQLPEKMQLDVLSQAGVNFKKDEVLRQPGVKDHWLIVGQEEGNDDHLRYRRTWLLGENSQQFGLLLDFAVGNRSFEMNWLPGSAIKGELIFYPSNQPQRALVGKFIPSNAPFDGLIGSQNFAAFLNLFANAIANNPWLEQVPVLLEEVIPTWYENAPVLIDVQQKRLPISLRGKSAWRLIALGGGRPISIFGTFNGRSLTPLSAFVDQRMVLISNR